MKGKLLVEIKTNLKNKKIFWLWVIVAIYPIVVLSYVWYHCYISDFQGGKNGQLDAYRHMLASAVVAYTLSPKAVSLFTMVSEISNEPSNLMDRQNNALGAELGSNAKTFRELNQEVIQFVLNGTENAVDSRQITWLEINSGKKVCFGKGLRLKNDVGCLLSHTRWLRSEMQT